MDFILCSHNEKISEISLVPMVSLGYIFYDETINFRLYQQDKKLVLFLIACSYEYQ